MKNLLNFFISFALLSLCGCNSNNGCEVNPGCPPPTSTIFELNFKLLDSNNLTINLSNLDLDNIILETEGIEENLILDEVKNELHTLLTGINLGMEPESGSYKLTTNFGEVQTINIVVSSDWADECHWCKNYFISEIAQNETDTIFVGELTDEVISIKVN